MFERLKANSSAVICSIIASMICVYFLDPILSFLGRAFLFVASFLGTTYTDRIYAQAAHLTPFNYSFGIAVVVLMGPVLCVSLSLLIAGCQRIRRSRKTKVSELKVQDTNFACVDQQESRVDDNYNKTSRDLIFGISLVVFSSLLLAWLHLVIGAHFVQLSAITSFQQHVRILKPFIDDETEERLISDWSRMSTKAEYDKIQAELTRLAQENNIELPDNRIYSLFSL